MFVAGSTRTGAGNHVFQHCKSMKNTQEPQADHQSSISADVTVKVTDMADHMPHGSALPVDTELNQYRLLRKIGQGGFGITYLALNTTNDEQVVIKENLPGFCAYRNKSTLQVTATDSGDTNRQYASTLRRFKDEARFLKHLQHPNIIRVYEDFEALGTAYYVMPYIEAKELHKAAPTTVNEAWLLPILKTVLSALSYLHDKGLLHRDLKPSNILLQEDGSPMIIDFGTARDLHTERTSTMIVGTHGYTPSEQMVPLGKIGPWTDIYALGATCYRIITGNVPPESVARLEDESLYSPLYENKELCKRFSPLLLRSIDIALATRAAQRWQTAGEWLNYLTRSETSECASSGNKHTETKKPKRHLLLLTLSILFTALGVGVYLLLSYTQSSTEKLLREEFMQTEATRLAHEKEESERSAKAEKERLAQKQAAKEEAQNQLKAMGIHDYYRGILSAVDKPETLRLLIIAGVDVNTTNTTGKTPLFLAADEGNIDCVKLLLEAEGININQADKDNETPLYRAAKNGHTECVRLLLAAKGINVNQANEDNETPLYCAANEGHTECVRLLLAAEGINVNQADKDNETPILRAARRNRTEALKLLLAAPGIDCNLTDRQGDTPLHEAIAFGHTECAQLLLSRPGVDINSANAQGETLLFLAAMHGRKNSLELLLALPGINVNKSDKYGRTPLCIAAEKGHADCLQLLLTAPGILINQEAAWGSTPLSIAAYEGHAPCVKLLLATPGIDVNKANKYGNTPLDSAARAGHTECVKLLLAARGININRANHDGVTPLKAATAAGHTECANLIRKAGGK